MKTLIVSLLMSLAPILNLYGQALEYTQHVESPFSGVTAGDCFEPVALSGTIHSVIHLTRSAKDNSITVEIQAGPRGDAQAVGMTTGNKYNIVGHTFERLQFGRNILEKFSYENSFTVVGLYRVRYTYHILFGDNYEFPKTFVDRLRATCE